MSTTTERKNSNGSRITRDTAVSIGLVAAMIAGAVWINGSLKDLGHEINLLRVEVERNTRNSALRSWVELFRTANADKGLVVPDVPRDF